MRRTGFDFNVNYHDEDPEEAFRRKAKFENDSEEVIDAEFEEVEDDVPDAEEVLAKYSIE